jgi:hypothetical protein
MNISQLSAKPQLVKFTIEDEEIVKRYGEAIEFWSWDRQPLSVFMRLTAVGGENSGEIISIVKDLILDSNGVPVITNEATLPVDVLLACVGRITEKLGK